MPTSTHYEFCARRFYADDEHYRSGCGLSFFTEDLGARSGCLRPTRATARGGCWVSATHTDTARS